MSKNNEIKGTEPSKNTQRLIVKDLKDNGNNNFSLVPQKQDLNQSAAFLGILEIKKVRFEGRVSAAGKKDWQLQGNLGATVVQSCVVTAQPVMTRIDTTVSRLYSNALEEHDESAETEFDGDDESELLESTIDLDALMQEVIALELPDYPRIEGAELGEAVYSAPGTTPLRNQELKPFASLASLKDKMKE